MPIATSTDWQTKPMPPETEALSFERTFSAREFELIRQGFIPLEMEDKWFIYFDNTALNFHRSWTGHHIYQVTIEQVDSNTYKAVSAIVNRNEQESNQPHPSFDISLLDYLIDLLLLGKEVSFPAKADVKPEHKAIYKHSIVGYGTPKSVGTDRQQQMPLDRFTRIVGCLAGGAIGDAAGSFYEGRPIPEKVDLEVFHDITDDTQLTLATCESIIESGRVSPENIAQKMLAWYNAGKLTGLGASTLKALRDLQIGAHWALAGRTGEYAAGNGAAMRIAPLAFFVDPETDRTLIRDVCNITHKNDEAYVGCLAIVYALHYIHTGQWTEGVNLLELITPELPDTSVRDNLMKLQADPSISIRDAAMLVGTSGHVIESIPFALFAAQKIRAHSFEEVLAQIILCGGDTDTNASIAGQIMGAFVGLPALPPNLFNSFSKTKVFGHLLATGAKLAAVYG